jgi:hypothetical protein
MSAWRVTDSGIYLPDEVASAWERVARNRYVAHIDMLGMSQLTIRNPQLAWSALSEMVIARRRRMEDLSYTLNGREVRVSDYVGTFTFSDTVLLFTRSAQPEDLRSIVFACNEMLTLLLSRSIPFRVGIAYGLFVFNLNEGVFAGPPWIQAYRLGEDAQWIGVVLDRSVAEQALQLEPPLQDMKGKDVVVQWEVPLRDGNRATRFVLAWPRSHRNNFRVQTPISVETFYQAFAQLFGPLSDLSSRDREKYANTVAFVNAMLD